MSSFFQTIVRQINMGLAEQFQDAMNALGKSADLANLS